MTEVVAEEEMAAEAVAEEETEVAVDVAADAADAVLPVDVADVEALA